MSPKEHLTLAIFISILLRIRQNRITEHVRKKDRMKDALFHRYKVMYLWNNAPFVSHKRVEPCTY